jgi:hypothetical protein
MKCLPFLAVLTAFQGFAQTTILSESFQSGSIPSNFTLVDNDLNTPASQVSEYNKPWIVVSDPENLIDSVAASTSYFTQQGSANVWMITPPISLGSFGNYIKWNAKSHDPSFPDDYLVLVSTTDTQLTSFTDTIGYVEQENFEWTSREVNLDENGYNNQTIHIAFVNITFDGFKLYVDDIEVVKEDPAGVKEFDNMKVKIYPNPCNDVIHIQSDEILKSISIKDLNGKTIMETSDKTIKLDFLQSGYYFVILKSEKQTFTHKVLKF